MIEKQNKNKKAYVSTLPLFVFVWVYDKNVRRVEKVLPLYNHLRIKNLILKISIFSYVLRDVI